MEEKRCLIQNVNVNKMKSKSEQWTIVNVTLTMDDIKQLIRGENLEAWNEQMGNAAIVINLED